MIVVPGILSWWRSSHTKQVTTPQGIFASDKAPRGNSTRLHCQKIAALARILPAMQAKGEMTGEKFQVS